MKNLYRGRYLIAVYDKDDNIIDVATSVPELVNFRPASVYPRISRGQFFKAKKYKVVLIDCLEQHDDEFAEEDKIFLQELQLTDKGCFIDYLADKYKVSRREVYRKIQNKRLNVENEMEGFANAVSGTTKDY